jgi:photosystem II stability/assembly factor-like uncharacterized protein
VIINQVHMIDVDKGWGIGGREDEHILRTTDGGRSWQDVTPPELESVPKEDQSGIVTITYEKAVGYFLDADTGWVAYYGYQRLGGHQPIGVWRTRDGGRTWELNRFWQRTSDIYGNFLHKPKMTFVDSKHGWILLEAFLGLSSHDNELYRTVDGGKTWQLVPLEPVLAINGGIDFVDFQHGWVPSYHFFGFHPPMRILTTDNGGLTWEFIALPYPDGTYNYEETNAISYSFCAVLMPYLRTPQAGRLVAGCDHREGVPEGDYFLYTTSDGARSWQIYPLPGLPEFISASTGWVLGQEESDPEVRVLSKTQDGGRTWGEIVEVDWFGQLHFANQLVGWAIVNREAENYLLHTTDGGKTWERIDPRTTVGENPVMRSDPPRITLPAELLPLEPSNMAQIQVLDEAPAGEATELAFSNYGNTLAVAQENGSLLQWDINGQPYPMVIPRHSDWVYTVEYSLNDDLLVSASKDGTIRFATIHCCFWVYRDLPPLTGHGGEVTSFAFAGWTMMASGSADGTVKVWDFSEADGYGDDAGVKLLNTLKGHTGWIWDVAYSPDRTMLASASGDGTVRLWDPESGENLQILRGHTEAVWRVAFPPERQFLASASWDSTIRFWDTNSGEELRILHGHEDWILSMNFSPDGNLLATGSQDGMVILWDTDSGELLRTMNEHTAPVRGISFSPDGNLLATVDQDGRLLFWGVTP